MSPTNPQVDVQTFERSVQAFQEAIEGLREALGRAEIRRQRQKRAQWRAMRNAVRSGRTASVAGGRTAQMWNYRSGRIAYRKAIIEKRLTERNQES